jgi:ATP-dependent helicase/nuclease subunit A
VALTRARDVLILCGIAENETQADAPWHKFCREGMERLGVMPENGIWRYGQEEALKPAKTAVAQPPNALTTPPEWVWRALDATAEKRRFINPSQVAAANETVLPALARQNAFHRGQLLHRLLQMLPLAKEAERETLAREFLEKQSFDGAEQIQKDVKEIMQVLQHPDFKHVFAEGSRAEVPVIGRVGGRRISGQIDRIAVTEKEVLIIDYKTNRPPPERVEDVQKHYLAQMAAYRTLLEKIYPRRAVRTALLWTNTLKLMPLDDEFHAEGLAILKGA